MNKWNVETNTRFLKSNAVERLYQGAGVLLDPVLTKKADFIDQLFGQGRYGFFVYEGQQLIGMARVFSDDVLRSWVAETVVLSDFQGQGVEQALSETIQKRFKHTTLFTDVAPSGEVMQQDAYEAGKRAEAIGSSAHNSLSAYLR
ncbi:GNAT family N-acetyltransferase [Terasakiella sp. SH-1]|uniref:GNAT family N-acetyltransferase n=1 Tax=Terasakiella sp. SH-1 TaxID=2560057 RepID=UPI001072F9F6|nr:GNAT family N-acetyltransferase [Terasakiella sp. SH-1]